MNVNFTFLTLLFCSLLPFNAFILGQTTYTTTDALPINITDDIYKHNVADGPPPTGMDCATINIPIGHFFNPANSNIMLNLTHPWVGDLVLRAYPPLGCSGTELDFLTLMNRPKGNKNNPPEGFCCGDDSNFLNTELIFVCDGSGIDPETLGENGSPISDAILYPNPDVATIPGNLDCSSLTTLNTAGTWYICVGDAYEDNDGKINGVSITLDGTACDTITVVTTITSACGDGTEVLQTWQDSIQTTNSPQPIGTAGPFYSSVSICDPNFPAAAPDPLYNGNGCLPETESYYAYYTCTTDNNYIDVGTFTLTTYPDISQQNNIVLHDSSCCPSFQLDCSFGYTVVNNYDDNGATPDCSMETDAGTIIFTVSRFGNNCPTTYTTNYNCRCPRILTAISDAQYVCQTGLVDSLQAVQTGIYQDENNTLAGISFWLDDDNPPTQAASEPLIYRGNGCDPDTIRLHAFGQCDENKDGFTGAADDSYILAGSVTMILFPDISEQAHVLIEDGNCCPSLTLACPNYIVNNTYDMQGANPDCSSEIHKGNIDFVITNPLAPNHLENCSQYVLPATYNCQLTVASFSIEPTSSITNSDGSVAIVGSGGTPPYTYSWRGVHGFTATTKDISDLHYGWYQLTLTDSSIPTQQYTGFYWVAPTYPPPPTNEIVRGKTASPSLIALQANPNPLQRQTTLTFSLPETTLQAEMVVYTINGQKVKTLYRGAVEAEVRQELEWSSDDLTAGIYIVQLATNTGVQEQLKLVVIP